MNLKERVRQIIARELSVSEEIVTDNATLGGDIPADSLDLVELTMQFEEEFGIEIPEDDIDELQTLGAITAYLERLDLKK